MEMERERKGNKRLQRIKENKGDKLEEDSQRKEKEIYKWKEGMRMNVQKISIQMIKIMQIFSHFGPK